MNAAQPRAESPEQVAEWCIQELREAMGRAGRKSVRLAVTVDGLHLTIGAKPAKVKPVEPDDLPDALRLAQRAVRRVYRLLRDVRAKVGNGATVMPRHLLRAWQVEEDPFVSIHTVNHSLRKLRNAGVAWSHPECGWMLRETSAHHHDQV